MGIPNLENVNRYPPPRLVQNEKRPAVDYRWFYSLTSILLTTIFAIGFVAFIRVSIDGGFSQAFADSLFAFLTISGSIAMYSGFMFGAFALLAMMVYLIIAPLYFLKKRRRT